MSLHGLTRAAVLLAVLLTSACSLVSSGQTGDSASVAVAPAPSAEVMADYSAALAALQSGEEAVAGSSLQAFSAAHPELAGPLLNLALLRMRQGDEAAALSLYERAGAVCERCAPVWNGLGVLYRQQGQFTAAEQAYQKAIELEPGYALAWYNLAVLYDLYVQQPALALQNYEQYLALGADDSPAEVERWIADLRRRVSAMPATARAEGAT